MHEKTQERVNRTGNPGTWVLPPHIIQTLTHRVTSHSAERKQGSQSAFPMVTFTSTLARDSGEGVNCSSLMWKMFCQLFQADEKLRAKAKLRDSSILSINSPFSYRRKNWKEVCVSTSYYLKHLVWATVTTFLVNLPPISAFGNAD